MTQWTAADNEAGAITLPSRYYRADDISGADFEKTPIKFITIERGNTYGVDVVYANVLPFAMEDVPTNYTIIPIPTNGFPVPITPIKKIDFTYSDTDAIVTGASTLLWVQ